MERLNEEFDPQDPSHIELDEEEAVGYWTRKLGVDELTLRYLVARHDASFEKVRRSILEMRRRG